jgi:hypothetical protein
MDKKLGVVVHICYLSDSWKLKIGPRSSLARAKSETLSPKWPEKKSAGGMEAYCQKTKQTNKQKTSININLDKFKNI